MKKKSLIIGSIILIILILGVVGSFFYIQESKKQKVILEKRKEQEYLKEVKSHYGSNVIVKKESALYEKREKDYIKVGTIKPDFELLLKPQEITSDTKYFAIENSDFYIAYDSVSKTDKARVTDTRCKEYLPFNENIVTKEKFSLYENGKVVLILDKSLESTILEKEDNFYKIEYLNQIFSVSKDDVLEIKQVTNTTEEAAVSVPVTVYHFIYLNGDVTCNEVICHSEEQIREQFQYLKENRYFTITTRELEKFMAEKIRLPKNSILITIDDGARAENFIPILEEYKIHATLFLVTAWYPKEKFASPYLEVASHTHDLHTPGVCSGGQGSPLKCKNMDELVKDLTTSRELLDTTALCFPFYEYNDHAIEALKKAGFSMGFIGGMKKVTMKTDPYKIPRITIQRDTTLEAYKKYVMS